MSSHLLSLVLCLRLLPSRMRKKIGIHPFVARTYKKSIQISLKEKLPCCRKIRPGVGIKPGTRGTNFSGGCSTTCANLKASDWQHEGRFL